MISICVTVKNRSRVQVGDYELNLFPNCVKSIVDSVAELPCELVVCDWESNDWPLTEWLPEAARTINTKLIKETGHFSRGRGLNLAATVSSGEILFFVDADALFTSDQVFQRGLRHLSQGQAYFPVLYSYADHTHTLGWWRHEGYGHCMLTRKLFEQSTGWPEYDRWGKEDNHFVSEISNMASIIREEVPGFFHQWHPEDIGWKDRYSRHSSSILDEIQRVDSAWKQIDRIVKPGNVFILVDETRFDVKSSDSRNALPFLERDGMYWGAPVDDEMAIREFERLREAGASHIVFGWMCFWWLQHYPKFAQYLEMKFDCVLENENLKVFDLKNRFL